MYNVYIVYIVCIVYIVYIVLLVTTNLNTRLHDIHVTKVPHSPSGGLVGLLESSPVDLGAAVDDPLRDRTLQGEHQGGHPILPQYRDLADTGGLFQAGNEERQSFMMHLTSCLENNR